MSSHIRIENFKRRELSCVLAIYFDHIEVDMVANWYQDAIQWFSEIGRTPELVAYDGHNSVERYDAVLMQKIGTMLTSLHSLELIAMDPQGSDKLMFASSVYSGINTFNGKPSVIWHWDSLDLDINITSVLKRLKKVLSFGCPVYGFGLTRNFSMGPSYYCNGILFNHSDYSPRGLEIGDIVSRWQHERVRKDGGRHFTGMLRDVYPINVLSGVHLRQRVQHESLDTWISGCDQRGTLHRFLNDLFIWEVPDLTRVAVREALNSADLLVCRRTGETMEDV